MKVYFFLFFLTIFSCQEFSKNSIKDNSYNIDLPYYNEPTFTPIWLDRSNSKINNFHSIKTFNFQNQDGKWISQNDLKGKIYIANLFFTSC